jgi:hypothetical protein
MAEWVSIKWRDLGYHLRGAAFDAILKLRDRVMRVMNQDD